MSSRIDDVRVVFAGTLRRDAAETAPGPAWILLADGRVRDIVPGLGRPAAWPDHWPTVDLARSVVVPGLIDSHVHLTEAGRGESEEVNAARTVDEQVALGLVNAATALRAGITTVADCGGRPEAVFRLAEQAADRPDTPRVLTAGAPITTERGHMWRLGGAVADSIAAAGLIDELVAQGADFVKVVASGGGTAGAPAWVASFSTEDLAAILAAGAAVERAVKVHCLSGEAMRRAVEAGVRCIEHGKFRTAAEDGGGYDQSVVDLVAAAGVFVCPTLSVGHFVLTQPRARAGDAYDLWADRQPHDLHHLSQMAASGVRMVAGTDAGWRFTPFDALVEELVLLASAGLTNRQSLASATTAAADAFGLGDRIGRIEIGYSADLVAVDEDPIKNLETFRRPRAVARQGRFTRLRPGREKGPR